ncbi:hypothetical protein FHS95_001759 [Sphingomonas naasensis]|uniref:Nuclease n=1 Tax=Sphingomonas naasensis TaxID=1344951 RepID=A0A4S1WQ36_9SPHN|nr:hypothetical protein [Sphingomonas naasensis]NIJ20067.1 hypothetical protein [Sphingomonas naasensis]TGX44227.1 hypothetical protein E5A74_05310 [Sphingomonas naasensis]
MKACAAIVAGLLASPVLAQDAAPKKLDPLAVQVVHNFGKCVAKRTPSAVEKVLGLDIRTAAYNEALRRVTTGHGYCLTSGALRAGGVLLAGALAEGALMADEGRGLAGKLAWHEGAAPIAARGELEAMGMCIVRKAPEATVALLKTEPTTEQETEALRSVTPFLGECTAKGTQVRINRPGLRAQIALAAYRITHTPASGS